MQLHAHKRDKLASTPHFSALIVRRLPKNSRLFSLLGVFILLMTSGGTLLFQLISHTNSAFAMTSAAAPANNAVLTFKNNLQRTGLDANETTLTTSNVNSSTFGKRVTYPVQGQVYAQPLYVPNLVINGNSHNVVIVATEHDQVYAFDADTKTVTAPLWEANYLINGATTVAYTDVACSDMIPEVGITGTPYIDLSTNTMYLVAFTNESGNLIYRLHAVDITTGKDKTGSPTVISGSVAGTGDGASNGVVDFLPVHQRQRAALTVVNGQIYVPFGSFCDNGPYHGWIFGYSYNSTAFQQQEIYNDSANGTGDGIWGAGGSIAADPQGTLYVSTGNGDADLNTGGVDAGDSVIKLNAQLQVTDYFTPFNASCLEYRDADLSSGGPMILPARNELFTGGKEGRFYVLNTNNLGKYTADPNLNCDTTEPNRNDIDKVVQEFLPGTVGGIYGNPAYYNGPNGEYVYFPGAGSSTKAFKLQADGTLSTTSTSQTTENFGFTGGNPSVSANGTQAGTGIIWIIDPAGGTLRAYDANDIGTELYNSNQDAARDSLDSYVKFSTPTIANGEVFVGTSDTLTIFGTDPTEPTITGSPTVTPTPVTYNNRGVSNDSAPETGNFDGNNASYSVQALQNVGINPGDNAFYNGNKMVFSWPNVLPGFNNNYVASGQTIPVTPMDNANLLGFLGAATNGPSSGIATINYTDGSKQFFTLGFSDWLLNGGGSALYPGNAIQSQMTYYNSGGGTNYAKTYLFYADVALQSSKQVASVTLPATVNQGQLHVFAVSTLDVPQPAVYNNIGTTDDTAPVNGNFDGTNSYSTQALSKVGITPGGTFTYNGVTFTWPSPAAATNNNYIANGQLLPITPVTNATTLAFLGAATGGSASGGAKITYADGSTQTFTLGMSDWTRGGSGNDAPSFGNQIAATTGYRNTPNGQQATSQPSIFYADVALQAGKTIQSVTLPVAITGGQLHIFTVATSGGTTVTPTPTPTPNPTPNPTPTPTPTPPAVQYNNVAISDDGNPSAGSFDGANSYSAQSLATVNITPGAIVAFNGINFTWPNGAAGSNNNYVANGQILPITPAANATTLAFLGAAAGGPSSGSAKITYSDGSTQAFTLGMSDWTRGDGTDAPSFSNQIVATTTYRNTPTGKQATSKPSIFYASVVLQTGKTIQSVTLPATTTGGQLHIFTAATGIGTTVTPTPTPTPIPPTPPTTTVQYNNVGVSDDSNTASGNFDGVNSYSAQALTKTNITPGATVTFNGVNFIWPNVAVGAADDYTAQGQVIPVTPVSNATTLAFLGAAINGNSSGTALITYTDGSTQSFTLGLSDWTLGGGGNSAAFGNQIVAATAYRNTPTGKDANNAPDVFYTDVTLSSTTKTVQSVTLPAATTGGQLHIFAISTKSTITNPAAPYTNVGTSDDANPAAGGFDGANSYSTQALSQIGITPGGIVSVNGINFTWPSATAGKANNYVANGQVLPLRQQDGTSTTTVGFLGAATSGSASGTATITYTDGTKQTFTLGMSDWTLGGDGTDNPSFGNTAIAISPYRNTPTGSQTAHKPVIFYAGVTIIAGKTVQSVTLPNTATGGQIHIFSVATK